MSLAPITLFTYNRFWHTQQTVESLQKNELAVDSDLLVFSDGPKTESDIAKVTEVRSHLKTICGFKSVTIIERDKNFGLAQSIINGVTDIVNRHGKIIVLEDDMVTSPYFLKFMNEALEFYKDEERVISIHGYVYPVKAKLPETFFLRGSDCWGWATWKRGWDLFESNGQKLLKELKHKKLQKRFDFNGAFPYIQMLQDQIKGKNDSWAVRWYASALLQDKLTLYPGKSLVFNIGNDESGTHCQDTRVYDTEIAHLPVSAGSIPVEESTFALKEIEKYLSSTQSSIVERIKKLLPKIALV